MVSETSFDRTLENDNQHIRSVCKQCGAVIVSSVLDGLAELEAIHLAGCKKPNSSIHIVPASKSNQTK
jgi:transcription initiation factor TFIIIB Brf1 subunit/transcription initiation factor TFIIB